MYDRIFKTFIEWENFHGEQLDGMELQAWSARQPEINKLKETIEKMKNQQNCKLCTYGAHIVGGPCNKGKCPCDKWEMKDE